MKKPSTAPTAIIAVTLFTAAFALPTTTKGFCLPLTHPARLIPGLSESGTNGEIVGLFITSDGRTHGFLLSGGEYTTIDVPSAIRSNALAINALGQIVGRYDTPDNVAHGYLLSGGEFTTIDFPAPPPDLLKGQRKTLKGDDRT